MHGAKIVKIRILYRIGERVSWIGLLDMTEICKILFFVLKKSSIIINIYIYIYISKDFMWESMKFCHVVLSLAMNLFT